MSQTCKLRGCDETVPEGRTTFCTLAHRKRHRNNHTGAGRRARAKNRAKRREGIPRSVLYAFQNFERAVDPDTAREVAETKRQQLAVRKLIEHHGWCAYENKNGMIRDAGRPRHPADAGKVFTKVWKHDE